MSPNGSSGNEALTFTPEGSQSDLQRSQLPCRIVELHHESFTACVQQRGRAQIEIGERESTVSRTSDVSVIFRVDMNRSEKLRKISKAGPWFIKHVSQAGTRDERAVVIRSRTCAAADEVSDCVRSTASIYSHSVDLLHAFVFSRHVKARQAAGAGALDEEVTR